MHDYLVEKEDSEPQHYENQKTFVSMKIYLIEKQENSTNVYAWVLKESYYLEEEEVKQDSGSSIPYKFILEKENDTYVVVDSRIPRDGSYYVEDMKNIFPFEVRKEMDNVHYDGTIDRLMLDIKDCEKLDASEPRFTKSIKDCEKTDASKPRFTKSIKDCEKLDASKPSFTKSIKDCEKTDASEPSFTKSIKDCEKMDASKPSFTKSIKDCEKTDASEPSFTKSIKDCEKLDASEPHFTNLILFLSQ